MTSRRPVCIRPRGISKSGTPQKLPLPERLDPSIPPSEEFGDLWGCCGGLGELGTPGGTTRSCARPWGCGGGAPGVSGGFWGFQEVLGTHPGAQHVAVLCQHGGADDSPLVLRALEMGVREQEKQLGELGGNGGAGGQHPTGTGPTRTPQTPLLSAGWAWGRGQSGGWGQLGCAQEGAGDV